MTAGAEVIYGLSLSMPDGWCNRFGNTSAPGPGQILTRLRPEAQEALGRLKSDDLANMRPDAVFVYDERQRRREDQSEMLLTFDRDVLGL